MRKMVGFRYFSVIVWITQCFMFFHREKRPIPGGNMNQWGFGVLEVKKTRLSGFSGFETQLILS